VLQIDEADCPRRFYQQIIFYLLMYVHCVTYRVSSIRGVEYELGTWSDAVQKARKKAVQDLRQLERTPRQDLVNGAVDCHLRLSNANNKNKKKYVIPAAFVCISNIIGSLWVYE
jgi:hypothetical protein